MQSPRKVEFCIELLSTATPISKVAYQMAPAEPKELKIQLDEWLKNGHIRPSMSPWEATMLS